MAWRFLCLFAAKSSQDGCNIHDGTKALTSWPNLLVNVPRLSMENIAVSSNPRGLRHGDGVADATEGVVAAIAAAGGDDEVVFAAGYWITKDDFAPRPKDDFGG